MAQIVGELRENSTKGERHVLSLLRTNLPNDFIVYVETPIYIGRKSSHPDFIILANYGFVVLEVKDWIPESVNKHNAILRNGVKYPNPVETARDYAIDLVNAIRKLCDQKKIPYPKIPYGSAVVMSNLQGYNKKKLRLSWGENFVFNLEDLSVHLVKQSIRNTIREDKIRPISKEVMDIIRGAINPEIKFKNKDEFVFADEIQSKLILEPITPTSPRPKAKAVVTPDQTLFHDSEIPKPEGNIPSEVEDIITSNSVRLIRGDMGSGKTLVLLGKAKRWAMMNPDWNILVLAYNKSLTQELKKELKGLKNIHTTNLAQFLSESISKTNKYSWTYPIDTESWLENQKDKQKIILKFGVGFLASELGWIQDVMIDSRESYLDIKRVGRGTKIQLNREQRNEIYDLLELHYQDLSKKRQVTWEKMYLNYLELVSNGELVPEKYDAILIDEAQDFAPSWIAAVNTLLKPNGALFMVDDPKQSIFKYFSWRQRGVNVVGRTRKLSQPYRNTKEIYRAAQAIIKEDLELISQLKSEGEEFTDTADYSKMRSGELPLLVKKCQNNDDIKFIENIIQTLKIKNNIAYTDMCVITPNLEHLKRIKKELSKYGLKILTCNQAKGITVEVVFMTNIDLYFKPEKNEDQGYLSTQRRIIYTCMGRPRQFLYLLHNKKYSEHFDVLKDFVECYSY